MMPALVPAEVRLVSVGSPVELTHHVARIHRHHPVPLYACLDRLLVPFSSVLSQLVRDELLSTRLPA